MNRNAIAVAASLTVLVSMTAAGTYAKNAYHKELYERFPEIDHKTIRKAYSKLLAKAFKQELPDNVFDNDAEMDKLFLEIVESVRNAKEK